MSSVKGIDTIILCIYQVDLCFASSPPDMFVDAATARGSSPQCSAKDGVAVEGPGAGPSRAQVPLCQRSAVLLRANGRCQRRLCPAACMTHLCSQI